MVRQIRVARPYCCDDGCDAGTSTCCLDTEPKQCQYASGYDAKVAEPVAITCTHCDGKWYVQVRSDSTIKDSGNGVAERSHKDDQDSISRAQTCGYD